MGSKIGLRSSGNLSVSPALASFVFGQKIQAIKSLKIWKLVEFGKVKNCKKDCLRILEEWDKREQNSGLSQVEKDLREKKKKEHVDWVCREEISS